MHTVHMKKKCPDARVIAKSWLHGYQLAFQGFMTGARATVIPSEGSEVPVIVWEISKSDEDTMDIFEGARLGYRIKETMEVEVDGEMKEALIYTMPPNPCGRPLDSHLRAISAGYREFNMDIRILNRAVLYSYAQFEKRFGNKEEKTS